MILHLHHRFIGSTLWARHRLCWKFTSGEPVKTKSWTRRIRHRLPIVRKPIGEKSTAFFKDLLADIHDDSVFLTWVMRGSSGTFNIPALLELTRKNNTPCIIILLCVKSAYAQV